MRREADPKSIGMGRFEVVIRAPTLGLVTRVPADQPDPRSAADASNVRFDDGVVRNAPGCAPIITVPGVDSQPVMIFQCNVTATTGANRIAAVLIGTAQKLFAMRNASEGVFGLTQDQVIEYRGDFKDHGALRHEPTFWRRIPSCIGMSIGDTMELWKLRSRQVGENDDNLSFILPIDYGAATNNKIWARIG